MNALADTRNDRSALERLLGLFTEVRAGESGTTLLLALNIFLLLTAYYIIKPVREALILEGGGASIPESLHDSLMARLDRLAPVRDVAQLGAVIGRRGTGLLSGRDGTVRH